MIIDAHTHSRFSMDSRSDPKDNILSAIDKGLDAIAFTDHVDRVDNALDYFYDFDRYVETLRSLKNRYRDEIDVLIGCEMGLNPSLNSIIEPMMDDERFDYFIGSLHTLKDRDIASAMRAWDGPLERYYKEYYLAILEGVTSTEGFHVLGHLDYIDRYVPEKSDIPPFESYREIVADILRAAIRKDLVVEYNTGGFYKGLDYGNPKDEILSLYRDLGGRRICLSSDAHRPEDIARGFSSAVEHLRALGFETITYFKDKKPIESPLG
ncbi:MAG: histidinol-phosphatase HisJ family protein [Peptoniphilus sp.]|nr:histidinol-phosphatase HisJ family protein [Peptoniphilus sp.]MDY6045368.1 histidinol-phosphatase HisJ family protein [Peptoniphilus sp.]